VYEKAQKTHRPSKVDVRNKKEKPDLKGKNPKAFTVQNAKRTQKRIQRKGDQDERKKHTPLVDRTPLVPPPIVVAIVGPPKVGKTILLQSLVKNYTKQTINNVKGPVTLVSGKQQRITLIECTNDVNAMIDVAKVADLVLLMVDASFGFEMEIFEFLNICQVHGFPRIMGVLTHLDTFKNNKALKRTKRNLKHRFWTEVYQGAKLFYLSGIVHEEYQKNEVHNLGRFISVMKFRPLIWRNTHPYLLADRVEDITDQEKIRVNEKCDRKVCLYGYLRGTHLKPDTSVHLAGVGDIKFESICFLPDPCALPGERKKRNLLEREKRIYAPMSGVGGVVYDKDAVYIDLGGSHSLKNKKAPAINEEEPEEEYDNDEEAALVKNIISTEASLTEKLSKSEMKFFTKSEAISSEAHSGGRQEVDIMGRRKVLFEDEQEDVVSDDQEGEDGDGEDDESGDEQELNGEEENEGEEIDGDENEVGENESEEEENDGGEDENDSDNENDEAEESDEDSGDEITFKKEENVVEKESTKRKSKLKEKVSVKKQKTVKDINAAILKEIGGDSGISEEEEESDDEIEEQEKSSNSEEKKSSKLDVQVVKPKSKPLKDGKFHHRLATQKDTSANKKVVKALNEIKKKKPESESDEEHDLEDTVELESEDESEMDIQQEDKGKESSDDENEEEGTLRWKSDLATKARDAFYSRQSSTASLRKLVYGHLKRLDEDQIREEESDNDVEEEGGTIGGLFKVIEKDQDNKSQKSRLEDGMDCSLFKVENLHDWSIQDMCDRIKDCFVTGKWGQSEDAEELLKMDEEDEEEVYGDFEDLETGEKISGKKDGKEKEEEETPRYVDYGGDAIREKEKRNARYLRKIELKKQFDNVYDDGSGNADSTYYDELKKEVDSQATLNKSEFESMDDSQRVLFEGFRPGMYVRIEINEMPCEFIQNYDPSTPVIVGGLLKGEEEIGYVQTRLKRHRWFPKILKNRDPFIVSLGWRRFQTLPIYSITDHNMRKRMLKYTPEHLHCDAYFWGPITPQGTGMLAFQSLAEKQENFRIVATGVVLELDKSSQIMKKLKLTGEPYKIFKKTAFIKGMFNSSLEVAKFEGAQIKTVAGIRGMVKRALSQPDGAFRATFEDKILMSDIVFVKTWFQVDVPKYYAPVTNLLLPAGDRYSWKGMRTTAQIKRDKAIRNTENKDSLYRPVERKEIDFAPLKVPKKLQEALPISLKPNAGHIKFDPAAGRVAVILDHKEQKIAKAFKMLRTLHGDKMDKLKEDKKKRMEKFLQKKEEIEARKMVKQKDARRKISKLSTQHKLATEKKRGKGGKAVASSS